MHTHTSPMPTAPAGTGKAARPYLGKLSRFSAAALAAWGFPRHVPSQPTPPGTREGAVRAVTSLRWHPPIAHSIVPASSAQRDVTPFLNAPSSPPASLDKEMGGPRVAATWTGIRLEMSTISSTLA